MSTKEEGAKVALNADTSRTELPPEEEAVDVATLVDALSQATDDDGAGDHVPHAVAGDPDPTLDALAEKINGAAGKLTPPETDNWQKEWPKSIVKGLKADAADPKRPEGGGVDLAHIRTGTENEGNLKSRLATEMEPAEARPEVLGGFLNDELSVIVGGPNSGANNLALAIAKAVAMGGTVLGVKATSAPVLYVDPVRPEDAIVAALGADLTALNNLLVMARGTTDADVKNEVDNLKTLGVELGLVVINEFGRIITKRIFDKVVSDTKTRYLAVVSEPKIKTKAPYRWDESKAIDMTEREHVIYLEPIREEAVRLTIVKYGEVTKDIAVDPKDDWKPLGRPKEAIAGKRQRAVLNIVVGAGEDGIEPKDIAALLDITPGNAYQALLLLTRGEKVFKEGKRYYEDGVTPKTGSDSTTA